MPDAHAVEHVVVADEDPDWRILVTGLVTAGGAAVVAEAADLGETVRACREHGPDILIIDLDMHDGDVESALREVSRRCPATTIIGLVDLLTPETHREIERSGEWVLPAEVGRVVRKSLGAQTLMRSLKGPLRTRTGSPGTDGP